MQLIKKSNMKLTIVVTMIISLFILPFGSTAMATEDFEQKGTIIAESVYYNTLTKKYEFDTEFALSNGLTKNEVNNAEAYFESLSVTEVEQMNNEIGFDESLEMQNGEITPSFIPAILIPIAKYLIGTAGAVIIYHVITYGIIKACKNLKGEYWFFTDFCETNGWL
ncbi:hypothetical protein FJQ98_01790 [Lysinibacillus agricola]|uniref:Uncharacterized protein n=1 Tax=Lysinibacillus agricola TaxID=2590012 RepID=A0ABX7ASA7_9BACI|nr:MULTISPECIES: hypothetical protein [Lysinibacillus]KOS61307.1 hypothetical protein AN161_18705 [Lysinibacillus sp. FJAT-14222]QQP12848.1 hypothetical protein FJQ98_01790 [Lysinibacillus agricola]